MRTVRNSSFCFYFGGCLVWGERGISASGRVPGPGGCLLWGGSWCRGCLLRGVPARGGSAPRGCLVLGGCLLGGSAPGWEGAWSRGGVVSQHALGQTPLLTEWLTDRCKNITFATSLRTVISRFRIDLLKCYCMLCAPARDQSWCLGWVDDQCTDQCHATQHSSVKDSSEPAPLQPGLKGISAILVLI